MQIYETDESNTIRASETPFDVIQDNNGKDFENSRF